MKPVFTRLSDHALLEKCLLGSNQNESFNNLVWSRCPKTEFCSPPTVQIAVNFAILTFNDGMMAMEPLLDRRVRRPLSLPNVSGQETCSKGIENGRGGELREAVLKLQRRDTLQRKVFSMHQAVIYLCKPVSQSVLH